MTLPSIDVADAERPVPADTADACPASEYAVYVRGLTKRYGDGAEAVRDVTVGFERGAVTGLLGANGTGKTTILKSILGLVIPTAGTITVGGTDVHDGPSAVHGRIAALFEGARNVYWRLSARENVSLFARLHGVPPCRRSERVDRALETVDLRAGSEGPVGALSRGMKQRCALACALVRDVPVLVLDEPTVGLDRTSRADLVEVLVRLVEREGRTVILSSHDMELIERVCDRAVVLDGGRVIADATVADLRAAFSTRACSVTVDREVDSGRIPAVTGAFETGEWQTGGGRTTFEVVLPEDEDVYSLVDRLGDAGLPIRSIENADPDLGSVFVSMAGDDAGETEVGG